MTVVPPKTLVNFIILAVSVARAPITNLGASFALSSEFDIDNDEFDLLSAVLVFGLFLRM